MDNKTKTDIPLSHKYIFKYMFRGMFIYIILALIVYIFASCSLGNNKKEEEQRQGLQQEAEIAEQQRMEMERALQQKEEKEKEKEKEKRENKNKVKDNVILDGTKVGGLEKEEVLKIIKEKASKVEKEPVNAQYNPDTWDVIPGKMGAKVDMEKTLKVVMDAEEGKEVKLVVKEISPEITKDSFKDKIAVISVYSTPIVDKSPNRIHNIELAISKIKNKIIYPNEEFSFNDAVGNRTAEEGYKEAIIIRRTKNGSVKEKGIGGGVCQLSTTIYKAVQAGGFKVTERHDHSDDITYAETGDDAAVSFGYLDFRFINDRNLPIMLKFSMDDEVLTVTIVENRIDQGNG
ncbi:MAG: vanomycin resistance protein VanB [Clostridiaceae bacterium]|nr:vanomycin resistance protein VanB [Clostridiaceae bacterium]